MMVSKMEHYSDLLEASIENIIGKKQEIGVASLLVKAVPPCRKASLMVLRILN
jgi:hypothetical protein